MNFYSIIFGIYLNYGVYLLMPCLWINFYAYPFDRMAFIRGLMSQCLNITI